MYKGIFRSEDNLEIKLGQRFYLINEYGKFQKKINWLGEHFLEWRGGYCCVNDLELNPDKKNKVKLVLIRI